MQFAIKVRVKGDLLGLARILRLFKSHRIIRTLDQEAVTPGEAQLAGIVESGGYPLLLALKISRHPNVLECRIEELDPSTHQSTMVVR